MKYKIKIKGIIQSDIFGCKYIAKYLNNIPTYIQCGGTYGGRIDLTVNKNDTILVNTQAYQNNKIGLLIDFEYEVEGIFEIYAKNPQKGAIINVITCKLLKSRL